MSGNGARPTLPRGWEWLTVGDVALECRRGRSPAYAEGATVVVNQKCIRLGTEVDLAHAKLTNEETKGLPNWALLQEGDVLINSTGAGTLGRVGWLRGAPERATLDTHVTLVRPDRARVLPAYLGWWLHGREADLVALATGSTNQKELSREAVKALELPVPPLSEQEKIVLSIETSFDHIQEGKQALHRGHDRMRLFERSILAQVLTRAQPKGVRLDEVGQVFVGATPKRSEPSFWGGGIPWVSSSEVAFTRIASTKETITEAGLGDRAKRLQPAGSVLIAMYGDGKTRGQPAILDIDAATNQAVASIRVHPDLALPEFVYYCLVQQYEAIREIGSGSQQKNLSKGFVAAIEIPCPPLDEQGQAVDEIKAVLAETRALRDEVARQVLASGQLRTAVLHGACLGHLSCQS